MRQDDTSPTAFKVHLQPCPLGKLPSANDDLVEFILKDRNTSDSSSARVGFIDLGAASAGDDWLFVTRLLSTLPKESPDAPPNLLVLDSVAGFETLVGEHDGFGQMSSRRSRIAQILRAAGAN